MTVDEPDRQAGPTADSEYRQTLETVLSNVPLILYTLDDAGVFTSSRGSALSEVGLEPGEVVGQSVFEVYAEHPEICTHVEQALAGESVHDTVTVGGVVFESWYEPLTDAEGEPTGVVGLAMDVTAQHRRQRELETYETALNTAADMVYQLDADGRFVMINDAALDETGYERSDVLGESVGTILTDESYRRGIEIIEQLVEDGSSDVATQAFDVETADGDVLPVESRITVLYDDSGMARGTIGIARNVSQRREYEEMLSTLHDISLGLLTRRDPDAVVDQIPVALDTVLEVDCSCVFLFDEERNSLEPASMVERTVDLFDEVPSFGPGDGLIWEAFVHGQGRVYDDVTRAENVSNPETPIRSEVLVPLGEHGLLACGSTEVAAFDDQTVELIDLLAATAESVLDRIDRDRRLQEGDRELQARIDRLDRQAAVEACYRSTTRQILDADSREAIYEIACRELATLDCCAFVWAGEHHLANGALAVRARAGSGETYLDQVSRRLDTERDESTMLPALQAVDRGQTVVVDRIADSLRASDWQPAALSRDFQSVLSVPIAGDAYTYGALSVYAPTTNAFDDRLRTVIADLGGAVAHAISSIEQRQSLAGDASVEVEFQIDRPDTPALALAAQLDAPFLVEDALYGSPTLLYGSFHGVDGFHAACDRTPAVESGTVLAESGTELAVRLSVPGETAAGVVAECGGVFQDLAIADGVGRLRATFPDEGRTGEAIRRITDRVPAATLYSRRQRTREDRGEDSLETLTDRQREALLTAYHGGYYEWPRTQSADALADVLGVSKSTFLEHLRRAERKLLGNGVPEHFEL
jgi:PAS domain S-box-containing protein